VKSGLFEAFNHNINAESENHQKGGAEKELLSYAHMVTVCIADFSAFIWAA